MPKVNGKEFPYTPAGMKAAKKAKEGGKASPEAKASYMAGREVKKQSEQMKQNPAAQAAKKAALKKKISSPKMAKAMPTGAAPKKAMPMGMKMLGKKMK
jgi:hypothetical protein